MTYPSEKEGRTTKVTTKKKWTKGKCYMITLTKTEVDKHILVAARSTSGDCDNQIRALPTPPAPAVPCPR